MLFSKAISKQMRTLFWYFPFSPPKWFWKVPTLNLVVAVTGETLVYQYTSKIWFESLNIFSLKHVLKAAGSNSGPPHTTLTPSSQLNPPRTATQPKRTTQPSFLTAPSWETGQHRATWPTMTHSTASWRAFPAPGAVCETSHQLLPQSILFPPPSPQVFQPRKTH